jgi:hypothetical protein
VRIDLDYGLNQDDLNRIDVDPKLNGSTVKELLAKTIHIQRHIRARRSDVHQLGPFPQLERDHRVAVVCIEESTAKM